MSLIRFINLISTQGVALVLSMIVPQNETAFFPLNLVLTESGFTLLRCTEFASWSNMTIFFFIKIDGSKEGICINMLCKNNNDNNKHDS